MNMTSASTAYFENVAEVRDALRAGYFSDEVRDISISKAYLRPEMLVADVGAGAGFMAAGLAPLVSRVYILDSSPAMLDVARRNLAAFSNVTYQVADGSALPLDAASIDAIFANMYLYHAPDPAAAIREMVRILRPGGRLVISDLDAHDHAWMREETSAPAPDGVVAGAGVTDIRPGFQRVEIKAWLRDAGLVNVMVDCTSQICCASWQSSTDSSDEAREVEISVFVATGSRPVGGMMAAVQEGYGAVAAGATDGCCGSTAQPDHQAGSNTATCCSPTGATATITLLDGGYAPLISDIPTAAASFSLGCGVPILFANLQPGETVLDIGSGGGLDAFLAARQVGPEGRVIGLDMTPAMIERARLAADEGGFATVAFRLGHAEEMPIEDSSVDIVISNCVINLSEDKGRVFEEAHRVLKPDGRLAISDIVSDGVLPLSMRRDPTAWAGCISGALPEREYLDLIAAAGFGDIVATRSAASGEQAGVKLYSLAVKARKRP